MLAQQVPGGRLARHELHLRPKPGDELRPASQHSSMAGIWPDHDPPPKADQRLAQSNMRSVVRGAGRRRVVNNGRRREGSAAPSTRGDPQDDPGGASHRPTHRWPNAYADAALVARDTHDDVIYGWDRPWVSHDALISDVFGSSVVRRHVKNQGPHGGTYGAPGRP